MYICRKTMSMPTKSKHQNNHHIKDIAISKDAAGIKPRLGFVLKKEPTIVESMCVLSILGISNHNCRKWFKDDIDFQEYLEQCRSALIEFLKGAADFNYLCNEAMFYNENLLPDLPKFLSMILYLHEKGII